MQKKEPTPAIVVTKKKKFTFKKDPTDNKTGYKFQELTDQEHEEIFKGM